MTIFLRLLLNSYKVVLFVLICISGLCISCHDDDETERDFPYRNLIIYLAGDNSLSSEVEQKINAISKGFLQISNPKGRLFIYSDSRTNNPQLIEIIRNEDAAIRKVLKAWHSQNSASAEVMKQIQGEIINTYPADSYGLIFFSHASGWLPSGTLQQPSGRSIGWDDNGNNGDGEHAEMELADFAEAIPDGQFDFIIFETCLTAGVEVAYALHTKTQYMLASSAEILSPGFSPVYVTSLKYLFDTSLPLKECLKAFGQAYMGHVNTLSGAYRSATLSLIETAEMEELATLTSDIIGEVFKNKNKDIAEIQHFDRPGVYGDSPALPRYFDFEQVIAECAETADGNYVSYKEQLTRTVVWKAATEEFLPGYTSGYTINHHCGLTAYLPQQDLEALNRAYQQTAWYKRIFRHDELYKEIYCAVN